MPEASCRSLGVMWLTSGLREASVADVPQPPRPRGHSWGVLRLPVEPVCQVSVWGRGGPGCAHSAVAGLVPWKLVNSGSGADSAGGRGGSGRRPQNQGSGRAGGRRPRPLPSPLPAWPGAKCVCVWSLRGLLSTVPAFLEDQVPWFYAARVTVQYEGSTATLPSLHRTTVWFLGGPRSFSVMPSEGKSVALSLWCVG